ncbi:MAG: C40 family peptidase [Caldimonas sp.]
MRRPLPAPGHCARSLAVALALSFGAGLAVAAPDETTDPVMKLLVDKGLVSDAAPVAEAASPAEPGLLSQVHDRASEMVLAAMNFVGVRYRRGGTSAESGFDCSGFTRQVFEMSVGLALPHSADAQAAAPGLVAVKREDLKPGDLVFFNTLRRTFSHVGIYIGDNRFIHAPRTGKQVRTEDMSFAYWAKRFTGARRVEPAAQPLVQAAAPATAATVSSQ